MASKSHGEKWRAKGFRPNHPVILIPGLCSSVLRVEQSPYEPWIGKNIWLDMSMIGLDKVLDGIPLFGTSLARSFESRRLASRSDTREITHARSVASIALSQPGRKKRKKSASSSSDSISISAPMAVHSVSSGSTNDVSVTHDMETGEEVKMANVDAAVRVRRPSAHDGSNRCRSLDQYPSAI